MRKVSTGELKANNSLAISYAVGQGLSNNLGINVVVELAVLLTVGEGDGQPIGNVVTVTAQGPVLISALYP